MKVSEIWFLVYSEKLTCWNQTYNNSWNNMKISGSGKKFRLVTCDLSKWCSLSYWQSNLTSLHIWNPERTRIGSRQDFQLNNGKHEVEATLHEEITVCSLWEVDWICMTFSQILGRAVSLCEWACEVLQMSFLNSALSLTRLPQYLQLWHESCD